MSERTSATKPSLEGVSKNESSDAIEEVVLTDELIRAASPLLSIPDTLKTTGAFFPPNESLTPNTRARKLEFKNFAMQCMRAFGALMHMRDDGPLVPYRPRTPSKYYEEKLKEAQTKLAEHEALTPEARLALAVQAHNEKYDLLRNEIERYPIEKQKLQLLLEDARAYIPPTLGHENFQTYMVDSLRRELRRWEVRFMDAAKNFTSLTSPLNGDQWFQEQKTTLTSEVEYYRREAQNEIEQCSGANEWVRLAIEAIDGSFKDELGETLNETEQPDSTHPSAPSDPPLY